MSQLLSDYEHNPSVRTDLDGFFSEGRIRIFRKALADAREQGLGLLEATEVVEPNPLDLNDSACYSNLFNCDQEGAYLFREAAIEQLKAIEEQNNLQPGEITDHAEHVVVNTPEKERFLEKAIRII
ncbi:hypothetical protein D3C86_1736690 [compost metagenome]